MALARIFWILYLHDVSWFESEEIWYNFFFNGCTKWPFDVELATYQFIVFNYLLIVNVCSFIFTWKHIRNYWRHYYSNCKPNNLWILWNMGISLVLVSISVFICSYWTKYHEVRILPSVIKMIYTFHILESHHIYCYGCDLWNKRSHLRYLFVPLFLNRIQGYSLCR